MSTDTALLVIDVQKGMFLEDESVYDGENLLSKISTLITKARTAGVPVIYVQHNGPDGDSLKKGSEGWPIHPAIAPAEGEPVVEKWTPDSFHETKLQQELESRGIKNLVVAGIQTECCVDTTCRRAMTMGYKTTLVKDAHSTWNSRTLTAQQIIEHTNDALNGWFVTPKAANEITFNV